VLGLELGSVSVVRTFGRPVKLSRVDILLRALAIRFLADRGNGSSFATSCVSVCVPLVYCG